MAYLLVICFRTSKQGCFPVSCKRLSGPEFANDMGHVCSFGFGRAWSKSLAILLISNMFHPVDDFAVLLLLNGNVRHGRGRCAPVPVLLIGREPDHVTGPDLFDGSGPALHPATTSRDEESLTQRMRMPRGPR